MGDSNGNIWVPAQEGAIYKRRWPAVHRGSKTFLSRVHLVHRLLVIETACCFFVCSSPLEDDIPPGDGIGGDCRTEKKRWIIQTMIGMFSVTAMFCSTVYMTYVVHDRFMYIIY